MLPVAILAGGLGLRLGPLTEEVPKCMIDVHGKPFLDHVLRLLKDRGVERVVLCVGHLGQIVEGVIGGGNQYGLQIEYSYDGKTQLGTAGALKKALPLLGEDFFVLYGDSYLPCDMADVQRVYEASECLALMTACLPPEGYKPNVWLERGRVWAHQKRMRVTNMAHIDYGLSIVSPRALLYGRYDSADLSDLFGRLAELNELAGYEVADRFHTIGTPAGLQHTKDFLWSYVLR